MPSGDLGLRQGLGDPATQAEQARWWASRPRATRTE